MWNPIKIIRKRREDERQRIAEWRKSIVDINKKYRESEIIIEGKIIEAAKRAREERIQHRADTKTILETVTKILALLEQKE